MRGGLGLVVEHDPVGRVGVGPGSVASKTKGAAASSSVRKSILQTETKTVTSESCHGSIRVKHNGDYLERRDDDDSSACLATSKSFRSRHSLSSRSPPPLPHMQCSSSLGLVDMDQIEITGVTSGLSSLGFNNHESEFIISPHEACETNNRHLGNKAVPLVLSGDKSWNDVDAEMKTRESGTSLYQSKKPTNAPSKQASSTGIKIGVEVQSGYTEHHCNVATPRNASCSLGMLGEFLGITPPKDNKPKTSPFKQLLNVFCSPIENSGPQDLDTNDRDSISGFSPVHNRDISVGESTDEFYRVPSFANENRNTSGQYNDEDNMAYGFTSAHIDNSDAEVGRMKVQNQRMQVRRAALMDSESDEDSI